MKVKKVLKKRKQEECLDSDSDIDEALRNLERLPETSDEESDEGTSTGEKQPRKKQKTKPASDESESDVSDESELKATPSTYLSHNDIESFRKALHKKPDINTLSNVAGALRAALSEAEGDETTKQFSKFRVQGSTMFNDIMRLCLNEFVPALHRVLNLEAPSVPKDSSATIIDPRKCHKWKKVSGVVKNYLRDMLTMTTAVTEKKLIIVLLRHILLLVPYYVSFGSIARHLLKKLVTLWSSGEESIRVIAFLCIIRIVKGARQSLRDEFDFDSLLRTMYMSYVRNCKFTSPTTWHLISFMKRSLSELYALDPNVAYRQAFLFIRQLAIHLRTAITIKKKDSHKPVYNWQYVHCCLFWAHAISAQPDNEAMRTLVFPLTQVITGSIRLVPTARYIPLRFHLVRGLIEVSASTHTFIPVLPHLLACFDIINFQKKPGSSSLKPLNLSCALRLSERQLKDATFRDAVVENFQELTLMYLSSCSDSVAFPELVLPLRLRLKKLAKTIKYEKHTAIFKMILEKTDANVQFIQQRRDASNISLVDQKEVDRFENTLRSAGTPMTKFFEQWSKLRTQMRRIQQRNEVYAEDDESGDEGPSASQKQKKKKKQDAEEKVDEEDQNMDVDAESADDDDAESADDDDAESDDSFLKV